MCIRDRNNAKDTENMEQAPEEELETTAECADADASEAVTEEVKEPTLEEKLEAAKAKADENYASYLRSVADLDTYRRRVMREKDELKKYAVSALIESILPIYDNMGLGLSSVEQDADPKVVLQGIQMVLTQFQKVLEENGVKEIAPVTGGEFDPNLHEAFQTQASDDVEEGNVLQLVRKGFSLNDRLIRPANVIVSGGKSEG